MRPDVLPCRQPTSLDTGMILLTFNLMCVDGRAEHAYPAGGLDVSFILLCVRGDCTGNILFSYVGFLFLFFFNFIFGHELGTYFSMINCLIIVMTM